MIVCLEGVDLAGKGTQAKLLAERLSARLMKFPNRETATGKMIYAHLDREWRASSDFYPKSSVTPDKVQAERVLDATVFQALHTVNRLEQAEEVARYRSTLGEWLVLDRYWPSGWVFGGADGLSEDWLFQIHKSLPQPDYFILLDVDLRHVEERWEQAVKTGERKPDRYESDAKVAVRIERYRRLWSRCPLVGTQWWVVNARGNPDDIHRNILRAIIGAEHVL